MYRMVIEIAAIDGQVPASLVVKGYRFSRYGPVAFVLNQVGPDALNRILDPVVPGLGLTIPGVTYIGIDSSRAILEACRTARLILGSSLRFRALVDGLPAAVERTQWTTMTLSDAIPTPHHAHYAASAASAPPAFVANRESPRI